MASILCVDDAPDTLEILDATLHGHDLHFAKSIGQAIELERRKRFDIIVLDIELPDGNGFDFMASRSDRREPCPVIFLTGKRDLSSKATAFALGADDFVMKPFEPLELKMRIEAKLKTQERSKQSGRLLRVGGLRCHLDEQRVECAENGQIIDLTAIEFRIFTLLARTPNKVFQRHEVLDRVWGTAVSVSERAVDVHVSHLRKKLSGNGVTIDGVVGSGYRILER